ncbi:MAG: helix-turn-helix domain-containing protein [Mangrovicoccus sp.]|nr:helix-turn-helix domain-containing protein [Mangrovicoccus sp.]
MTKAAQSAPCAAITPEQCRAARGLLGWSQTELADRAGVSRASIADFESGARNPMRRNLHALSQSLAAAGVAFLDEEASAGVGLRFRYRRLQITGPAKLELIEYCAHLPMHYGGADLTCVLDLDAVNEFYQTRFTSSAGFEQAIADCEDAIRATAESMVPERIRDGKLHITYKMLRRG